MNYLLSYLLIFLYNTAFMAITNKSYIKTFPISMMSAAIIVYVFGLFTKLSYGIFFLLFIMVIGSLFTLYKIIKKQYDISRIINFNTLLITLVYFYLVFISYDKMFNNWDDYMHWGSMVKYLFQNDQFYCYDSNYIFAHKDYPPIMPIFNMIYCFINGGYKESYAIIATQLLQVSIFVSVVDNYGKKFSNSIKSIIVCVCCILATLVLPDISKIFYSSLYTDGLIGLLFGYCLYHVCFGKLSKENLLIVSIVLCFMTLLKQIGLAFSLLIVLALCIKFICCSISNKTIETKILAQSVFILLIIIISYFSWELVIKDISANGTLINQFSYSDLKILDILDIINGNAKESWQITTAWAYIDALKNKIIFYSPIQLGYYQAVILIDVFMIIVMTLVKKEYLLSSIISFIIYNIGAIGYAVGMLLLYVFAFGPYEGPILASYERYMQTYILAGIIILFYEVVNSRFKFLNNYKELLCIVWIVFVPINDYYLLYPVRNSISWGEGLSFFTDKIIQTVNEDEKILVIENNVQTINHYIMGYQLMPITIDVIDEGFDPIVGDKYCMEMDKKILFEKINECDYLYIDSISDNTKDLLSPMSDTINIYSLYRIIRNEENIELEVVVW